MLLESGHNPEKGVGVDVEMGAGGRGGIFLLL